MDRPWPRTCFVSLANSIHSTPRSQVNERIQAHAQSNQCATRRGARMHNVALVLGAPLSALSREVAVLRGVTPALLTTPAATLGLLRLIVAASCSPLRQRSRCRGARQHLRRCAIVAAPFRLKPKGVPKTITETRARSPHRLQKKFKTMSPKLEPNGVPKSGTQSGPRFRLYM